MGSEAVLRDDVLSPYVTTEDAGVYLRAAIARAHQQAKNLDRLFHFTLPGLQLTVRSFEGAVAEGVERNLLDQPGVPGVPAVDELEVVVAHAGLLGMPACARWGHQVYSPHRLDRVLAAEGLRGSYNGDSGHWYAYDLRAGVAVELLPAADGYPPWEPGAPLRPILHWYYAQRDLRLAHGGTLGLDGVGTLLVGAGGSGKSGTVLAGVLYGLDTVGDDYVLLDRGTPARAYPLYAPLRQDPAGFERLELERFIPRDRALNWQGKHQFSIAELGGRSFAPHLEIKSLLLPRLAKRSRTRIRPASRADGMRALAMSSIGQMPGERESGFRFFGDVARRLPCFHLEVGEVPEEIAARVERFLREGTAD